MSADDTSREVLVEKLHDAIVDYAIEYHQPEFARTTRWEHVEAALTAVGDLLPRLDSNQQPADYAYWLVSALLVDILARSAGAR